MFKEMDFEKFILYLQNEYSIKTNTVSTRNKLIEDLQDYLSLKITQGNISEKFANELIFFFKKEYGIKKEN